MLLDDATSRIVHGVYEAALNPTTWHQVLKLLAQRFRARMTSILEHTPAACNDVVHAAFGLDTSFVDSYQSYFCHRNIYLQHAMPALRAGMVVPHTAYCSDQDILRSEYYQDFQRRLGLFHVLAGVLSKGDGSLVMVTVNRSREQRAFSEEEIQLLRFLVPHLQRARAIEDRLGTASPFVEQPSVPCDLSLTVAERRFAGLLASGCSLQEIAGCLNIRYSTAKTHLRHLFHKTGTHRQAELVSRLVRPR